MPEGFADESEAVFFFNQGTPPKGDVGFIIKLVRQCQEKEIGASVSDQSLELCTANDTPVERFEFANHAKVSTVADGFEIVRMKFGEERIGNRQRRVMDTKICFQEAASSREVLHPFPGLGGAAIIASQIGPRLFALEDGRRWSWSGTIARNIGAVT